MLKFSKLNGTGNDFIFIDLIQQPLETFTKLSREQVVRKICDRHFGVGADGMIFVEKIFGSEALKWDFYNRDASRAEFCGNAARCFGLWNHYYYQKDQLNFQSVIGDIKVEKQKDELSVFFAHLSAKPMPVDFRNSEFESFRKILSRVDKVFLLNSGVPHFVVVLKDDLLRAELLSIVGAFRFHKSAGVNGANVTFLFEDQTKTFERGVEDFTLSCGTGVLAAASTIWLENRDPGIKLKTPGGVLRVEIIKSEEKMILQAHLIGPAEFICEGYFKIE
jgi:diaminopimelate epimerase